MKKRVKPQAASAEAARSETPAAEGEPQASDAEFNPVFREDETDPAHLRGRRFLLLQGPQSGFFRLLAEQLEAAGARVDKVCFCGGDVFLWGFRKSHWYRGDLYSWPAWIGACYRDLGITDVCLYGDWRPRHWEAVRLARARGIRVWVFEEGYLRSGFSTLERNGVNGRSRLPREPEFYRRYGALLPDPEVKNVENDIRDKVWKAILHHTGNVLLWPVFHKYRTHRPTNIFFELLGILPRFLTRKRRQARSKAVYQAFCKDSRPYYFFPLQLVSDSQIQLYSPYVRVQEAIADVISSFARFAPPATRLLIKNHPLDNGLIRYGTFIQSFSKELGLDDRVTFVEDGSTADMIHGARAVVLVNSTVGLMALDQNKPVFCLGTSVYNLRGLTESEPDQSMHKFWRAPHGPDQTLYRDFKRVLAFQALVHGNFYSPHGMSLAAADSLKRFARADADDEREDAYHAARAIRRTAAKAVRPRESEEF